MVTGLTRPLILDKCILGNCLQVMQQLPENIIDLTVTSPPYDKIRNYKGYTFDFENIAKELYRITKDNGVLCWIVKDQRTKYSYSVTSFRQLQYFQEIGFNFYDLIIYEKNAQPPPHAMYYNDNIEYCFVLSKGKPKTFNPIMDHKNKTAHSVKESYIKEKNGKRKKDRRVRATALYSKRGKVWKYNVGMHHSTKDKFAFSHPAVMPEQLAKDCITSWSNPGDIILDPLAGSGTTLKMARLSQRHYLGIEVSPEYHTIIQKRLAKYDNESLRSFL